MTDPITHALTPETLAELRRLCEGATRGLPSAIANLGRAARDHLPALLNQLAAQRALLEEAERVCEPLARRADDVKPHWGDNDVSVMVNAGILRAARTFLAKAKAA